jgi:glycolate oxidase iron-sulfur subunit
LAEHVIATLQGDQQVLVDSAGCGTALKAYGDLLGTPEAKVFSERVLDVHEWLAERSDALPLADVSGRPGVIVQDPCHLRHVQGAHGAVRQVLGHCSEVVELNDDGLCCGAGGSYSLLQPVMATAARDRKVELIRDVSARSGANIVVSANPGCSMHLATAGIEVLHPIQVLAGMLASPGEVAGGSPAGPAGGADGR